MIQIDQFSLDIPFSNHWQNIHNQSKHHPETLQTLSKHLNILNIFSIQCFQQPIRKSGQIFWGLHFMSQVSINILKPTWFKIEFIEFFYFWALGCVSWMSGGYLEDFWVVSGILNVLHSPYILPWCQICFWRSLVGVCRMSGRCVRSVLSVKSMDWRHSN